jgi:anti-sigma regulatory factor (Ser/Thr protein kinase)
MAMIGSCAYSLSAGVAHDAFFYESVDEYIGTIVAFVRGGARGAEPALVAVPRPRTKLLRALLDNGVQEVAFADMTDLGRNPARIIADLRRFVHAHRGTASRFVGEPAWPGRSAAEYREIQLHQALLDVAVEDSPVSILCPYDATALTPEVMDDACRTHAHVVAGGGRRVSPSFDPQVASAIFTERLPAVPAQCHRLIYDHGDLARLRRFIEQSIGSIGFRTGRLDDLLLAVNEVATNTLVHSGTPGLIRIWRDAATLELVCDLSDAGHITEPLAGRLGPYPVAPQGWGLWMVNQVCDLVEIRSGEWGTNVRLHMRMG